MCPDQYGERVVPPKSSPGDPNGDPNARKRRKTGQKGLLNAPTNLHKLEIVGREKITFKNTLGREEI